MKKVVLNEDLNGFKYTLFGFTNEEYIKVRENFEDDTDKILLGTNIYNKSNVISKGTIPRDYPYKNKKIIPTKLFREIGSNRKDNKFITSYFCYTLNKFGDPTLIQHEEINSAWRCMLDNRLYKCTKLILIKEAV